MKIFLFLYILIFCINCTAKQTPINESTINRIIYEENKTQISNTRDKVIINNISYNIKLINSNIWSIENSIKYNNKDILTVYNDKSKESDHILINHENIFLLQTDETQEWFYLISDDFSIQGYIYLYDISEISFYGETEANQKNGNNYVNQQKKEHEIIKKNKNINRYGPLLSVEYKNKTINFLDKNNEEITGIKYLLLDYYPDSEEILIMEQYWENASMFIYNLDTEEYRCENIEYPYYNDERTYMLSIIFVEDIGPLLEYNLKLFKVDNGYYNEIFHQKYNIDRKWSLNRVNWKNNNIVSIDYDQIGGITIEIGDAIIIKNNLPSLSWDDIY